MSVFFFLGLLFKFIHLLKGSALFALSVSMQLCQKEGFGETILLYKWGREGGRAGEGSSAGTLYFY